MGTLVLILKVSVGPSTANFLKESLSKNLGAFAVRRLSEN